MKHFPFYLLFDEGGTDPQPTPEEKAKAEAETKRLAELEGQVKDHPYTKRQREEITALKAKLKEREDAEKEAEKAKLKEDNEWKKLAEKEAKEKADLLDKHAKDLSARDQRLINAEIKVVATNLGAKPEVIAKISKLIDRDEIKLDDEGNVIGAEEQLKALKEEMPFLFGEEQQETGGGNNPPKPPKRGTTDAPPKDYKNADRKTLDDGWRSLGKTG